MIQIHERNALKMNRGMKTGLIATALAGMLLMAGGNRADDGSAEIELRARLISTAKKYLGTTYRYGGMGMNGFDCSGYVQFVYRAVGIALPRSTPDQFEQGTKIDLADIRPGDLLFYRIYGRRISHVGIYLGDSQFIHAPSFGKRVSITLMDLAYWKTKFAGAVSYIIAKKNVHAGGSLNGLRGRSMIPDSLKSNEILFDIIFVGNTVDVEDDIVGAGAMSENTHTGSGERGFFNERDDIASFFAPGRINIIGEHLDYNGGYVLPAAISLGITGRVQYRDDRQIHLKSESYPGEIMADLDKKISFDASLGWANYPLGIIGFLIESGREIRRGMNIHYLSTLPPGAGLSSSAAIEMLTAFMLTDTAARPVGDLVALALLAQKMENEFIGVRCGIMDQFAVAMGKKRCAILLDSGSLRFEHVALESPEHRIVIMNTNTPRELAASRYNERRSECREAFEAIKKKKKHLRSLSDADPEDLDLIWDDTIRKRARHVITENRRVRESAAALRGGDLRLFGQMLAESHRSLQYDYEVSGFELDTIVSAALEAPGCIGARMTGAGFGGCALALVRNDHIELFKEEVGMRYRRAADRP